MTIHTLDTIAGAILVCLAVLALGMPLVVGSREERLLWVGGIAAFIALYCGFLLTT